MPENGEKLELMVENIIARRIGEYDVRMQRQFNMFDDKLDGIKDGIGAMREDIAGLKVHVKNACDAANENRTKGGEWISKGFWTMLGISAGFLVWFLQTVIAKAMAGG